jgi:hypothetical protein
MEIASVFIVVCSIALLVAIAYLVWGHLADKTGWISDGLQKGDLYSLIDVASGMRPNGLSDDQALRLRMRGFVRELDNGRYRATFKGRLALRLKRTARKRAARAGNEARRGGEGAGV